MPRERQPRYTILIYCEGKTEFAFVKYLKGLFVARGKREVKIRSGKGGGLATHVGDVRGICQTAEFQEKYILLDEDNRGQIVPETFQKAQEEGIQLIWPNPCIEGLYLLILERNFSTATTSANCKRQFENNYLTETQKLEPENYSRHFTKELLVEKKESVPTLNQIIRILTGE